MDKGGVYNREGVEMKIIKDSMKTRSQGCI